MRASLKRKQTKSACIDSIELKEKKKKEINICETELWEALAQCTSRLNTLQGKERKNLLKEMTCLCETFQLIYGEHAEISDVKQDRSFTMTIRFKHAYHLIAFKSKSNLDKLEDCLMNDLKKLPGCQKYDLTDTYIEVVKVDEELCEEAAIGAGKLALDKVMYLFFGWNLSRSVLIKVSVVLS